MMPYTIALNKLQLLSAVNYLSLFMYSVLVQLLGFNTYI